MKNFELFIELTRLKKPIGFLLLFWPCVWGLTLANDFSNDNYEFFKYCILFLMGAILMRSAGCIVNDILDRKIDIMVERTKNRPIPSNRVLPLNALLFGSILCVFGVFFVYQTIYKS